MVTAAGRSWRSPNRTAPAGRPPQPRRTHHAAPVHDPPTPFHKGAKVSLTSTSRSLYSAGPRVPISRLRTGDLVFWSDSTKLPTHIHHVALYVGGGKIFEADRVSGPDIRVRSFSTREFGVMPYVVRPVR
jgi:hypothetical protein